MAREKTSIIGSIRKAAEKSGGARNTLFYVKDGGKAKVRFLRDFEEGVKVIFHDSYTQGINTPCLEYYGKDCKYCAMDPKSIRTRELFAWPIWNYETQRQEIFLYAVNSCTPIMSLLDNYDEVGTITDRDYVIKRSGTGMQTNYTLISGDTGKFRAMREKDIFDTDELFKQIKDAFSDDSDEEEEVDEKPAKKSSKKKKAKQSSIEDELEMLSLKELRKVAKALGEKVRRDDDEDDLIEVIMEYEEEDIEEAIEEVSDIPF